MTMLRSRRWAAFWGVLLIVMGAAFLLQEFNLIPEGFLQWWPILVVGAGLWLLARGFAERRGGALIGGTLVSTMGVFWLLQNLGRVPERIFLPVILIALGAGLLLRSLLRLDRVS
jgi:hypothetical protein